MRFVLRVVEIFRAFEQQPTRAFEKFTMLLGRGGSQQAQRAVEAATSRSFADPLLLVVAADPVASVADGNVSSGLRPGHLGRSDSAASFVVVLRHLFQLRRAVLRRERHGCSSRSPVGNIAVDRDIRRVSDGTCDDGLAVVRRHRSGQLCLADGVRCDGTLPPPADARIEMDSVRL